MAARLFRRTGNLACFGSRRSLATVTYNKNEGAAGKFTIGPDEKKERLGENEVAINFLAAPVSPVDLGIINGKLPTPPSPSILGEEGVGIVSAVGSKVKNLTVNDWVVPIISHFGTWRSNATAKEADVIKIPSDIKVEYAANFNTAVTALKLLEDFGSLQEGDFLIQNTADSAVGLAIIQIAKLKGIGTINIIADGLYYSERAGLIKDLGADVVMKESFVGTPSCKKILSELPKPKIGFTARGAKDFGFLSPLVGGGGGKVVSYGGNSKEALGATNGSEFWAAEWLKKASPAAREKVIEDVAHLFRSEKLELWVERHPFNDLKFAVKEADEPFKTRRVTLIIQAPPKEEVKFDTAALESDFEAAFNRLRAI